MKKSHIILKLGFFLTTKKNYDKSFFKPFSRRDKPKKIQTLNEQSCALLYHLLSRLLTLPPLSLSISLYLILSFSPTVIPVPLSFSFCLSVFLSPSYSLYFSLSHSLPISFFLQPGSCQTFLSF